ncbi:MAG: aspartate-semialdehyde dehydrogenase [Alphaproteobacteria bacterium]|jgi:aspartate-semialdehyde dehydrogenase|nr:aspartate-semialdehyde dehydrogenase [Alphaproteobacteria bacterium]
MSKLNKHKIVVVGATGNVGRAMLSILAERGIPFENVTAVASERSAGGEVSYGDSGILKVYPLSTFDFQGMSIALFSPGGKVSAEFAPKAVASGCVVIDNTSHFRNDPDIPLVVPEVNPEAIAGYTKRRIIANPNCSLIQLVVALKPLHKITSIKRVVLSTYQSVSGAGKDAMDELLNQTRAMYMNSPAQSHHLPRPIAFNVIPQIGEFREDGSTEEEWKIQAELQKILSPDIQVAVTCVRVPVFIGHSIAATVEFEGAIPPDQARKALKNAPGIIVTDNSDESEYLTPIECVGEDPVYISRIRQDKSVPHGLNLWIVADNVRKGAALNAIQIAEILAKDYLNKH